MKAQPGSLTGDGGGGKQLEQFDLGPTFLGAPCTPAASAKKIEIKSNRTDSTE